MPVMLDKVGTCWNSYFPQTFHAQLCMSVMTGYVNQQFQKEYPKHLRTLIGTKNHPTPCDAWNVCHDGCGRGTSSGR